MIKEAFRSLQKLAIMSVQKLILQQAERQEWLQSNLNFL